MVRIAQIEKILILVGKVSSIEIDDEKMEPEKCNFYNHDFCKRGSHCDFLHNHEVVRRMKSSASVQSKRARTGICTPVSQYRTRVQKRQIM